MRNMMAICYTVICAGNYDNDIDMLKVANISCAPENASEGVKK